MGKPYRKGLLIIPSNLSSVPQSPGEEKGLRVSSLSPTVHWLLVLALILGIM